MTGPEGSSRCPRTARAHFFSVHHQWPESVLRPAGYDKWAATCTRWSSDDGKECIFITEELSIVHTSTTVKSARSPDDFRAGGPWSRHRGQSATNAYHSQMADDSMITSAHVLVSYFYLLLSQLPSFLNDFDQHWKEEMHRRTQRAPHSPSQSSE